MSVDKFGRSNTLQDLHGFHLTANGDYDLKNKRITNLNSPQHDNDAINKLYLESALKTYEVKSDITLEKQIKEISESLEEISKVILKLNPNLNNNVEKCLKDITILKTKIVDLTVKINNSSNLTDKFQKYIDFVFMHLKIDKTRI